MRDALKPLPPLDDLRGELESALSRHRGEHRTILTVARRQSAYRTSFPLEEVDVALDDGSALALVVKDVSRRALSDRVRRAKPAFVADSRREVATYQGILAALELGTAVCYGTSVDPTSGRHWLFLERVKGVALFQIGDRAKWEQAARWLARFHLHFAAAESHSNARSKAPLLCYDRDFYLQWPRRALAFARALPPDTRRTIEWLAGRYEHVIDQLVAMPTTVIHGEYYASNILVGDSQTGVRVCPVDWEMTAIGPGLVDLAALVAGSWSDADRQRIACAYYEALGPQAAGRQSLDGLMRDLALCRLHLAMQWLGWSADWTPPPEHAHDWLSDALGLAEELRL